MRFALIPSALVAVVGAMTFSPPAAVALTAQECSAKYKAAKEANTLGGKSWNDFRKSECGDAAAPAAKADATKATTAETPKAGVAKAASSAQFPASIDKKYASEKPAKARLHTCADQYKANKASNANGGMKWIEKGGGYWSECNKKLKG